MCGIGGLINNKSLNRQDLVKLLEKINFLQKHRGPDGEGIWIDENLTAGLSHVRLSIIDLAGGSQPMTSGNHVITFNGEIYNYLELREELKGESFATNSDTEVIIKAYEKWGAGCLNKLRGMFSFAIWDKKEKTFFAARDRFGIKPFYYAKTDFGFVFASEIKALLPFLKEIRTDMDGLKDYLTFQFVLGEKTLFESVSQLLPAHYIMIKNNNIIVDKYWEVEYQLDWHHTKDYFKEEVHKLLHESVRFHLRSDVDVGAYLSGGFDSSTIASMAKKIRPRQREFHVFTGKFSEYPGFDESRYSKEVALNSDLTLHELDITAENFINNIRKIIYHLDYPVAGPGSFPQYMISQLAARHLKVVLGGQGGDEIFGGYVRYLISYFEQCIKGAIEGTMSDGNYIVTYESIIPNLKILKSYKSLLQEFWKNGLFDNMDSRYFRLINRANEMNEVINWQILEPYSAFDTFKKIFWGKNVGKKSYFDLMTHFDFKTLLPSLLHVEDRMSMAHGLESRVPFLDHPLVELVATVPSNIKFENGNLKHLAKIAFKDYLPESIYKREDKMGFPVPLTEWMKGELFDFINDIFNASKARERCYISSSFNIHHLLQKESKFSRKIWGLLCLELWQQEFHDNFSKIKYKAS